MPLKAGKSHKVISENISEFHGGKTYASTKAKFGKERADRQAVAVAMSNARKYASGGSTRVPGPSFFQRDANRALSRQSGLIRSVVPGRTDKHNMRVASGSYIIPADVVSHLGQNNTLAGAKFLKRKFGGGGTVQFADGGAVDMPVDIIAAGGEYVLSPEQVAAVGKGDLKAGHSKLDKMVLDTRKHHIRTLKNLAPPKRS